MKKIRTLVSLFVLVISCKQGPATSDTHQHHDMQKVQEEKTQKKSLSPHTFAMAMVGDAHVHIDYSSPSVRGRLIFGGLLAYDEVWQAGAHKATWIETNKDLIIESTVLPAGKYGFFTIPSKEEWTVMFNKNWDQHGKDEYDEKEDVLRFKIKPIALETATEKLRYKVQNINDQSGSISLEWENLKIEFPFSVKK